MIWEQFQSDTNQTRLLEYHRPFDICVLCHSGLFKLLKLMKQARILLKPNIHPLKYVRGILLTRCDCATEGSACRCHGAVSINCGG